MIRLGLAQLACDGTFEENLTKMACFAARARAAGCAAVCFPEASITGYAPQDADRTALRLNDAPLREASRLAVESGVDLLAGFMEREGGRVFLSHGVFRADGAASVYRKTHLGAREERFFAPGGRLETFDLSCGLRVGFQLCVEAHFPQITQTLALRGAEVVFSPHAAPGDAATRRRLWETYVPARAYDNRLWFACCNQLNAPRFGGGCLVAGPDGAIAAADFERAERLVLFEVDRETIANYRDDARNAHRRYYPPHRRPELYER